MDSKVFKVSWILLVIAGCVGIVIGLLVIFAPNAFVANEFLLFTGHQWSDFKVSNPQVSSYISISIFEIGFFALAAGISILFVTLFAYRKREKWAWYLLLIVNTLAYGAATRSNVYTGDMAVVVICIVFLVIAYIGLAIGAKAILKKGST
jgi:uncharacterized membrane protein HdeD (DUF308 family)